MNGKTLWRAAWGYLRDHAFMALWGALCLLVFGLLCWLYGLPPNAALYAALLCAAVALIGLCVRLPRYLRRHAALGALREGKLNELSPLPQPQGMLERDYDALLTAALQENARILSEAKRNSRRQLETYSLWTHQIKVPISAMRLLLDGKADRQTAALLAELFKIEQYADMALSYARLNAASTDYVLKEYPLDDILRQLLRRFAPLFIQKKLSLRYEPTALRVLTDEKWLLFALEQILSNAIKYTREGGISIVADETAETVAITDTGIGIAKDDLPRVFEQGYTGYNGRGDKRATGLGLYLCREALQRLGHSVSIQSQTCKGTTVTVVLGRERVTAE